MTVIGEFFCAGDNVASRKQSFLEGFLVPGVPWSGIRSRWRFGHPSEEFFQRCSLSFTRQFPEAKTDAADFSKTFACPSAR